MQISADAIGFKPPRSERWPIPVGLALVAHALLMAALTWGVHWKQEVEPVHFEAELWSVLPREAAPRAVQLPPPPEPPTATPPTPKPLPPPQPTVKPPDIATEKAKKQQEDDKKRALEAAKKEKARKEQAEQEAKARDDKKAEEQKQLAEKKKKDDLVRQESERHEAALADKRRKDQIARTLSQAVAGGGPQNTGTALQSSDPSPSYGAKVASRIKPNVVFTDLSPGNSRAEVEVRTAPDGSILARKLVKSSGNPAWDDAVLRAIDRTGSLPRDVDGRVPSTLVIGLRPLD